jgi:DNA-binding CsgD family transcriptional regulator
VPHSERISGIISSRQRSRLQLRFGLTRRELEVALLLHARLTNREIAGALGVSDHTARHHTETVLRKLGLSSRQSVRSVIAEMT